MKFFNILSIAAAGLAVCSFLPAAQGAAVAIEKRDAASDCKVILDNAKGKITPLKSSKFAFIPLYNDCDAYGLTYCLPQQSSSTPMAKVTSTMKPMSETTFSPL